MRIESGAQLPGWAEDLVSALDEKMGLTLSEVTAHRVAGSMPVAGNTQPFLLWHGGASCVLVETLSSLGAACLGYPSLVGAGVDINVTHLRPVRSGRVHGVATPVRTGGRTVVFQAELRDDDGELVAVGRLTCRLVKRP
ncbi:MAG: PaaI family thioesterase [Propionibacteriaceae bacterium]|nr:PaaI family thioesterase [Propionibacteriaceae bacterium]